jgi:uncharacterized protein (DUF1800 family)
MSIAEAAIAAGRFGYGARPGELTKIASDPRGWIKAQLAPETAPPPAIAALPAAEDDLLAFGRWLAQRRAKNASAEEIERQAMRAGVSQDALKQLAVEDDFRKAFRDRAVRAIQARLDTAVSSPRPAYERLVHFWSNHFTVSAAKPVATALPPSFERDVVRPRATGRFADMLLASSQHPGMLVYLDNWLSVGPNSDYVKSGDRRPLASGQGRPRGLNENLAREILELHTMGVGSGYTQADVQALAAIITGWTFERPTLKDFVSDAPGTRSGAQLFKFEPRTHEPGPKTLLGKSYAQDGRSQGEAALRDIARQPATARFIATKLCRHYIADTPPSAAVARVGDAFQRSDGDLRVAMTAVIDSPETWAQPLAKYKRPEEYAISVSRALNLTTLAPGAVQPIVAMGQRIYAAPGPDGWSDLEAQWLSSDLLWKRIEFAQAVAGRAARADVNPLNLGEALIGPLLSDATRQAVARAQSPVQGLALLLASPEFQRR